MLLLQRQQSRNVVQLKMVMIYQAKIPEAWARMQWCERALGAQDIRWWRDRGYLCFRNKADYMLYLLRWS